jgi:hypothetical protein
MSALKRRLPGLLLVKGLTSMAEMAVLGSAVTEDRAFATFWEYCLVMYSPTLRFGNSMVAWG